MRAHDPAAVEILAYAEVARPDEATQQLQALTAGLERFMRGQSMDAQVAEQIRPTDGIDILVDLAGHTANHRLGVFARRPAPVQVTYLGYPCTTGLAAMDYRFTDAVADPVGEPSYHAEELVRLGGCFCCYAPPADAPGVGAGPSRNDGPITFGSPHKLIKLNDGVIELWARVLGAVPASRLLLCRNTLNGATRDYWQRRLQDKGIAADRIEVPGG